MLHLVPIVFYASFADYLSVSVALVSWIGKLAQCVPIFTVGIFKFGVIHSSAAIAVCSHLSKFLKVSA